MKDSLGSVQSVLVLGGGSEIALATVRELVARRATTVVLAARRPDALDGEVKELRELAGGRPNVTIEAVPFDADALDTHDAFIEGVFDRFGDFEGFILDTEDGNRRFKAREPEIEQVVNRCWSERILTSVFVELDAPHRPEEIVLHCPPRPFPR